MIDPSLPPWNQPKVEPGPREFVELVADDPGALRVEAKVAFHDERYFHRHGRIPWRPMSERCHSDNCIQAGRTA